MGQDAPRPAQCVHSQRGHRRADLLSPRRNRARGKAGGGAAAAWQYHDATCSRSAKTLLDRRNAFTPSEATVEQIYYRPGETVPAGRPVVALLPPGNLKIRFFAPQAILPEIKYGDVVGVSWCVCEKARTAKGSFIARSAEFTPPVIYSQEERAKLVFLIEARPEMPDKFRVGQPVTVTLSQEPRK